MNGPSLSRREFVHRGTRLAAGVAVAAAADSVLPAPTAPAIRPSESARTRRNAMKIGFHTDAFNSAYFSFEKCLQWA